MVNVTEFNSIFDLLQAFPNEQACIQHLEKIRWNGEVTSPFDPKSQVYKCKDNRYKCKNSGKYFNVKVATIFEDTKIPLQKWFLALYIFSSHKKGISSHQLAKDISVTQKSAWFMLHRLRYAFDHPNFDAVLRNENEMEEIFIGEQKKSKQKKDVQGSNIKSSKPNLDIDENKDTLVVGMASNQLHNHKKVKHSGLEQQACSGLKTNFNGQVLKHSAKKILYRKANIMNAECIWSHLKRGIDGIYHWCSEKHLHGYINEYKLRYITRNNTTQNRFNIVLSNMEGRLMYKVLISNSMKYDN